MRFALALLALLAGCLAAAAPSNATRLAADPAAHCPAPYDTTPPQPGWNRGFSAGGQSRAFYLMLPAASDTPAPVFVAFNGTSEDAAQFAARARLDQFVARGFVVIAPASNGNGTFWPVWDGLRAKGREADPNADVALFDQLLACVAAHVPLDRDRVYVGGHSAGGIFTNHLLQRRSDRIAGAIVGSGVYSQTTPAPAVPLDPTTVIVTWGGDNDRWSGRAGATAVRDFGFVAEAAAASHAYAKAPGVGVASCEGDDLGHAWLAGLNGWMIDVLLAHPKGAPPLTELPPLPAGANATCVLGAVQDAVPDAVSCPASDTPGCQYVCQQLADGVVRNRTVGPVLRGELARLGFDGEGCGRCVTHCEQQVRAEADSEVLACVVARPPVDPDARGIDAAMPLIDAVDGCCTDRGDSGWCRDICGTMRRNIAAKPYFGGCPR